MTEYPKVIAASVILRKPPVVRNRAVVVVIVGLVAAFGVGIWWYMRASTNSPAIPPISDQVYQSLYSRVEYDEGLGSTTKALTEVNSDLKQNLTATQRVGFWEEKATIYENSNNLAQALSAYQESAKLQDGKLDVATAQGLLYIYGQQGNKAQAAIYCNKLNAITQAVKDPVARSNLPTCDTSSGGVQ